MRKPSEIRAEIERLREAGDVEACEKCIAEKNVIIARVAEKIQGIRNVVIARALDDPIRERFVASLYAMRALPEDDREAAVDRMFEEVLGG